MTAYYREVDSVNVSIVLYLNFGYTVFNKIKRYKTEIACFKITFRFRVLFAGTVYFCVQYSLFHESKLEYNK